MTFTRLFVLMLVLAVLAMLYLGAPGSESWWLKCPMYQITGWQCPLCGLQRAVHALLHGDLLAAWRYNPALWLLLPYVAVWLLGCCSERVVRSRVYAWCTSTRVVLAVLFLLCVWGVLRNVWE
ncbi:MAG: DUF2752 domain-containing protein [Prevotellamassilia sp.]|nr:DUF2752 domain-containing protein [Prevotellamassilia sp.]